MLVNIIYNNKIRRYHEDGMNIEEFIEHNRHTLY